MHEDMIIFSSALPGDYPFRIAAAGSSYCDGSYRITRHNSSVYVFEYIESGSGYLRINGDEFHPEAGDVYIVPYGSDHEYGSSRDNPWVKHWFNVSGRLVGELLDMYKLKSTYLFKQYPLKTVFLDGLQKLAAQQPEASTLTGPQVIMNIILHLAAHRDYLHEKISLSPAAKKLQFYLDGRVFGQPPALDDMCAEINLSPAQTNRVFKSSFGQTPYQYLLNLKMAAARELLDASVRSIREIAFSLGFTDEYYFSNLFKKKNGISPRNYRYRDRM
ncbi:MAG: AraC family transcriptional regulator [Victivallales bacterium]